jgi:integrase
MYVEKIRTRDVEDWKGAVAAKVNAQQYAPSTFNTWLAVLKVVLEHAKRELELPQNAARDVLPLDLSRHRVYTREEPNALTVAELRDFLAGMHANYPQYFAMTYTGFATGLRPSSLRPLRRSGSTPDIDWEASVLLVRQSNSRGDFVMEGTKTGIDQEIAVPAELLNVLRWHVDTQLRPGPQKESELLFPSEIGGFRSRSCLDKPFADVAKAIGLKKHISPRAMRRTFQRGGPPPPNMPRPGLADEVAEGLRRTKTPYVSISLGGELVAAFLCPFCADLAWAQPSASNIAFHHRQGCKRYHELGPIAFIARAQALGLLPRVLPQRRVQRERDEI